MRGPREPARRSSLKATLRSEGVSFSQLNQSRKKKVRITSGPSCRTFGDSNVETSRTVEKVASKVEARQRDDDEDGFFSQ